MPWATVKLMPGADVELTPTLNRAAYVSTAFGRFKAGVFQKLGGWTKFYNGAFAGTPRALHAWQDLNRVKRLAIGTTETLSIIPQGGVPSDITPQTLDTDGTPDFSTTSGSTSVEIVDTNTSGLTINDAVYFRTPVSIGGIILSGIYAIATITGADSYTIEARSAATATEANLGAVPEFDTTSGSASVVVTLADHGQSVGNIVVFDEPTIVGGVTVSGKYTVITTPTTDTFTINVNAIASSTTSAFMNSGNSGLTYHISLGPTGSGSGYGVGTYGTGLYGLGTSPTAQTGTPIDADNWTLDNWGEILFSCPENGGIYYWQPDTGFLTATLISGGPYFNRGMFASMGAQQVIAFGSSVDARDGGGIGIYQDPLLLKWCDVANFFQWRQLASNFAREFRLPTGSEILAGAASKNRNLVWTDLNVWSMTFNGSQSVYSVNKVGDNCGIVGTHAWAMLGDTAYWMGKGNFFSYSGAGVLPMPCKVWDAVFQDLDDDLAHLTVAASNTDFTEISFFYVSLSGTIKYAKYNIVENEWDIGTLDRTAWIDRSVLGNPIGAASTGVIYYHESGNDADNDPLTPSFETGRFMLSEGEDLVFVDEVYPDFRWGLFGGSQDAQVMVTVIAYDESGSTGREYGPYAVTQSDPVISLDNDDFTRPRCRELALKVESSDIGSFWRLGAVRFRYAPDGRR